MAESGKVLSRRLPRAPVLMIIVNVHTFTASPAVVLHDVDWADEAATVRRLLGALRVR